MVQARDERVAILLKEYDTLRAEIISRCNNRFGVLGIIGGTVAFISAYPALGTWVLGGIAVLFLFAVWMYLGHLIYHCGIQVADLERRINKIVGEDLLAWESRVIPRIPYWPLTITKRDGRQTDPPTPNP